jgi:hypothetical protein
MKDAPPVTSTDLPFNFSLPFPKILAQFFFEEHLCEDLLISSIITSITKTEEHLNDVLVNCSQSMQHGK